MLSPVPLFSRSIGPLIFYSNIQNIVRHSRPLFTYWITPNSQLNTMSNMSSSTAPKMEYTRLGNSCLKISKVILGAMSFGSPDWEEWVIDEAADLPLLKHAYDVGLNTWDTADLYSNGKSEEIIGKALKQYNIPRNRVIILSKCTLV